MAVRRVGLSHHWIGTSGEEKPDAPAFSTFFEKDTKTYYVRTDTEWVVDTRVKR